MVLDIKFAFEHDPLLFYYQLTNACSLQEPENLPVSLLPLLISYQIEWSHKIFFDIHSYTLSELR